VYPLTPDAPVCELFSVDMGVCGGHMREKVQANGADCRNLRPTISRNLAVGREKRKCLPRVVGTGRRGFSRCRLPKR
jgi:hypothetical protein